MAQVTPLLNLRGVKGLIKRSKLPLTPLHEAITNSLEALDDKPVEDTSSPEIVIKFFFTGMAEEKVFQRIEVSDNGVDFTDTDYDRFKEFFDNSKGHNNRGSGRLQFLHRFELLVIDSVFVQNGIKRVVATTVVI